MLVIGLMGSGSLRSSELNDSRAATSWSNDSRNVENEPTRRKRPESEIRSRSPLLSGPHREKCAERSMSKPTLFLGSTSAGCSPLCDWLRPITSRP